MECLVKYDEYVHCARVFMTLTLFHHTLHEHQGSMLGFF
jgi:hypothetical protein